jgi:hypothetical protein
MDLISGEEFMEIDEWRERTLAQVLRVVLTLAILAAIPYSYFAITQHVTPATYVNFGGIILMSIASMRKRIPYTVRAILVVMLPYIVGTTTLFLYGTLTLLYLVAFPITAVIFLGARFAAAAVALAAVTLFVGGQFTPWNPSLAGIGTDHPFVKWGILAFDYACISSGLTLACAILLRKVEMSLKTQKLAAHSVELRQQEITRLKRELEAMRTWNHQSTPTEIAAKDFSNPFV